MNRLPILKEFLKGGNGAVIYKNVDIEFVKGRKATLTIHKGDEDGEIIDTITLSDYETEKEMHDLFKKFGFKERSPEDIETRIKIEEQKDREAFKAKQEENIIRQKQYRDQRDKMKAGKEADKGELSVDLIKKEIDEIENNLKKMKPTYEEASKIKMDNLKILEDAEKGIIVLSEEETNKYQSQMYGAEFNLRVKSASEERLKQLNTQYKEMIGTMKSEL